jgi:hypothetical protein
VISGILNEIAGVVLTALLVFAPSVLILGGIFLALYAGTDQGREMGIQSDNEETK